MPLLVVSGNLPEGTDSLSRKRSHQDYLDVPSVDTKTGLRLLSGVENMPVADNEQRKQQQPQALQSPLRATLHDHISEVSDSPLSMLTDASSSTPTQVSSSPNPSPSRRSGAFTELMTELDAVPADRIASASGGGGSNVDSASSSATTSAADSAPPPAKRKRPTPVGREEKAKADAARKLERGRLEAIKKQERDEKNAAAEAKKKAVAEEREKRRKQKEGEEQRRAERNEEKERKRKLKEEEERKAQEAKNKKDRSQMRINAFFGMGSSTPKKRIPDKAASTPSSPQPKGTTATDETRAMASPQRSRTEPSHGSAPAPAVTAISEYDRVFKPFFVKDNVVMVTHLCGLDDETKRAKASILDQHLASSRSPFNLRKPFNHASAVDYFHLACCPSTSSKHKAPERGRKRPTVREVMTMLNDNAYGYMSGDGQDPQTKAAFDTLRSVPMKYLAFREDVRPPYYGTVTSAPPQARLGKLARNPLAKTVLPLNYDYDSEAEWVDDGDGEDVDDLDDEEEVEPEEDEEMADFLDDSEDNAPMPLRSAFSGGMEPASTGLCWENERRRGPLRDMDAYRMEFILDYDGPIDPMSSKYWETPRPTVDARAREPKTGPSTLKGMLPPPPPAPGDALTALLGSRSNTEPAADAATSPAATVNTGASLGTNSKGAAEGNKKVGVAAEFVKDLKETIVLNEKLSKIGLVEVLSVRFLGKCTKSQIKVSIEALAERTGPGQHKTWKLKE